MIDEAEELLARARKLRMKVSAIKDGRCGALDDDLCRCLRTRGHQGPCDFSYTPWLWTAKGRSML